MEFDYIPKENQDKILNILNKCLEVNPNLKFHVIADDEGDLIYHGKKPEDVVHEMNGMDCNFGVNCMDGEKCVAWFFFTPYEDIDEIVCDYSDNDFCKEILKC